LHETPHPSETLIPEQECKIEHIPGHQSEPLAKAPRSLPSKPPAQTTASELPTQETKGTSERQSQTRDDTPEANSTKKTETKQTKKKRKKKRNKQRTSKKLERVVNTRISVRHRRQFSSKASVKEKRKYASAKKFVGALCLRRLQSGEVAGY